MNTAAAIDKRVNKKAVGKFSSYYSASIYLLIFGDYCWSILIFAFIYGRYIRREKNRNIVEENGNKMSLSPVDKFIYPTLDVTQFRAAIITKPIIGNAIIF